MVADTKTKADKATLSALRCELAWRGYHAGAATDRGLGGVLDKFAPFGRDAAVDLAADAITMVPRPAWVREFVGAV